MLGSRPDPRSGDGERLASLGHRTFRWRSSDEAVAAIEGETVRLAGPGQAKLEASEVQSGVSNNGQK